MFNNFYNSKSYFKFFLTSSLGVLGFVALMFQVVFVRELSLLFGLTAPAVATVIAVFFFGLGLGGLILGRLADKVSVSDRYKLYSSLFVIAAVYGFTFPLVLKLLNFLIVSLNHVYPLSFAGFNLATFVLAFVFLAPPALAFGAALPLVSKIFIRQEEFLGKKFSLLYFIDVFGSVLGAVAAGFWLIPTFGNTMTIFTASGIGILMAGILSPHLFFRRLKNRCGDLFLVFRSLQKTNTAPDEAYEDQHVVAPEHDGPHKPIQHPIFLLVLFLTGFLALALEVLYTKTLILFIGSSTYAFSLILSTFLLGIALGSWILSFFADGIKRGYAYFGVFLGLIGFWLFLTLQFFEKLPFWYLQILDSYESFEFGATLLSQSLIVFLAIFPATFLIGIIFPLGIKLADPYVKQIGAGVGRLYFANTFGGVLGSLSAGFLFLPIFGYSRTLVLILLAYFFLGGIFIAREKELEYVIKGTMIFFLVFWAVFSIFSSPWSKNILSLGIFPYAQTYVNIDEKTFRKVVKQDEILFYKEGLSNVAVIQRGGEKFLRVNGKTDASTSIDDKDTMILSGMLPMLFHSDPKDALVIGLGSGITLGSISRFDEAKNIDVVEIDPGIVEAAGYFNKENHNVLNDSRVKTIIADGRNYLSLTDKKYDVISSQPSNFWVSGNSLLFTKEFYELLKSHLKNEGIILQWLQTYSLESEDVKSVLATFQKVFPQAYLFESTTGGNLFLLGSISKKPILDFSLLEKKFDDPKVQVELGRLFIVNPYQLLSFLVTGKEGIENYTRDAEIHADNRPFIEFSAPKALYKNTLPKILEDISFLRDSFNPADAVVGADKDTLEEYTALARAIIPVKIALAKGDLFGALDYYKKARKTTGLSRPFLEAHLLAGCNKVAAFVKSQAGSEEADKVWNKCGEAFQ